MSEDAVLNTKEKEMIALGASIAAGCQPCTIHHIEAARTVGTCDKGTTLAVTAGADVRRAATETMAAWGMEELGGTVELPDEWLAERRLIRALVSVAAAFAVNSVTEFHRFAEEAQHLGASDRQVQMALAIARKIKGVASEKMEAAAQQLLPECEPKAQRVGRNCGCGA